MSKFFIYPPSPLLIYLNYSPSPTRTLPSKRLSIVCERGWGGGQPGGEKLGEGARRAGEGLPVGNIQAAPGWGAKKAQPK